MATIATTRVPRKADEGKPRLGIVDTDVHHGPFDSAKALGPYLSKTYKQRLADYGGGGVGDLYAMNGGLRGWRADMMGGVPARRVGAVTWDSDTTRKQLLDACGVEIGILTGGPVSSVVIPDLDYASALCRAFNEWSRENWLDSDKRYRLALQINASDPEGAAQEIDRLAGDARVCAILLGTGSVKPYGHRFYRPIHEACARHDLPIAMHLGGMSTRPTAAGFPSYYIESRFHRPMNYAVHITSFIFEGVFDRYPGLKVCSIESGINWVPGYLWRMDSDWKSLRNQTPWVKRPPSEYVFDRVRFSSQPIEDPETKEGLAPILEWIQASRTLMFSSDYPHFDWDDPAQAFPNASDELKQRLFSANARETYRL